jgi:hypothetical protein
MSKKPFVRLESKVKGLLAFSFAQFSSARLKAAYVEEPPAPVALLIILQNHGLDSLKSIRRR